MSDLIRREDVDKAIQSICEMCGEDKKNNGVMCGACNLDSFIREYEDIPSAEPGRKWIPVTEALPKEDEEVLVTVHFDGYKDKFTNLKPNNYVGIASHIDGEWSSYDDEYKVASNKHHVIAWMPLPEPWRGE